MKDSLPDWGAARRIELVARGLGFTSNAALRAKLDDQPFAATVDERAAAEFAHSVSLHLPRRLLSRTLARSMMEPIVEENPILTMHGFGIPDRHGFYGPKYEDEFKRSRAAFYDESGCDQFELALLLLQHAPRRKTLNMKNWSYGIKHIAEDISRAHGVRTDLGNYVSNGSIIVAAYYEGFLVRRARHRSLNAFLNISARCSDEFASAANIREKLGAEAISMPD